MKTYMKPALEVISVKTSENIAADTFIKSFYKKAAGAGSYDFTKTETMSYTNEDELLEEIFKS